MSKAPWSLAYGFRVAGTGLNSTGNTVSLVVERRESEVLCIPIVGCSVVNGGGSIIGRNQEKKLKKRKARVKQITKHDRGIGLENPVKRF
ncbi:hypothetical protein [Endozoicomonas sp. SESOKO1]|uniref:hypothetical protein n=1 Tax=Endozoicomonas sp. SESOKO1 TaxID=2828742 RepID=UPI002148E35C|nr:hypothetical protein [Endozoicomonas sp. SESOKO1]